MRHQLVQIALVAATAVTVPSVAAGGDDEHRHQRSEKHASEAAASKVFTADEPLVRGMSQIEEAVHAAAPKIKRGAAGPAEASKLGATVDREIATIFAECKLEPAADAALHDILLDMKDATGLLERSPAAATEAVAKLHRAVKQYHATFEPKH